MSEVSERLYVLKLENGKYYIGKTENVFKRMSYHKDTKANKWISTNPIVDLLEMRPCNKPTDENALVKEYMSRYGIPNVRGGSYSTFRLNKAEFQVLQHELHHDAGLCFKCKKTGHFAKNCPGIASSSSVNLAVPVGPILPPAPVLPESVQTLMKIADAVGTDHLKELLSCISSSIAMERTKKCEVDCPQKLPTDEEMLLAMKSTELFFFDLTQRDAALTTTEETSPANVCEAIASESITTQSSVLTESATTCHSASKDISRIGPEADCSATASQSSTSSSSSSSSSSSAAVSAGECIRTEPTDEEMVVAIEATEMLCACDIEVPPLVEQVDEDDYVLLRRLPTDEEMILAAESAELFNTQLNTGTHVESTPVTRKRLRASQNS